MTLCAFSQPGACKSEIEIAANAVNNPLGVTNAVGQVGSTLYVANAADQCRVTNCRDVCR
jgi:hypothetical protein